MSLVLGILANLIGGSTYFIQKTALAAWPPAILVLVRMAISLPILFVFAPRSFRATRGDWTRMAAVGVFGLAAPHLIGCYGLKGTQSLNAALLIGLEPITIVLLSALFLRERIGAGRALGISLGMIGATLVVSGDDLRGLTSFDGASKANALLALHGMLWALYTVLGKPTLERVPPLAMTLVTSCVASAVLLPVAAFELETLDLDAALKPAPLASLLYLGLFVSFGATVLWNVSLKGLTPSQMAALIFLQPLVGVSVGWFGGESIGPAGAAGALLVLGGVWLTERKPTGAADTVS